MTDATYRDLCLPPLRICAGPHNQTELGLSSESKGSYTFARKKQSNQLHSVLSHKPREDSRLMHINCPLQEMTGIPLVPGTTCSNSGSQNYYHALLTVKNVVPAASV